MPFILAAGHELTRLRDCMAKDTKDLVIAVMCAEGGHVLVSHDNDFKAVAKRLQLTRSQYQKQLHRIKLSCTEPEGAKRMAEMMSLIEHEWSVAVNTGGRLMVDIRSTTMFIAR